MNAKVLMLTQYPYKAEDERLGGIMQASYRLVDAIDQLNDERLSLSVLTQSPHVQSKTTRTLPNGTTLIFFPTERGLVDRLFMGYPSVRRALSQTITGISPHLVHGQGTAKYIYASTRSHLPHVITLHGIYGNEMKVVKSRLSWREKFARFVKIRLERHYVSGIQNLIAITNEVSSFVRLLSAQVRVFEIDNTIDESFFNIPPLQLDQAPNLLFVAAITYRKGLDFLLEGFAAVIRSRPEAKLRIAGISDWDPTYVAKLKNDYKHLIDTGSVTFLGGISQEQLIEEMSRALILCVPSRAESAPMVISQAMAAARPVIASAVGGIPGMVTDNLTGRLWSVGDVGQLTRLIVETLSSVERAMAMGINGRQMAIGKYAPKSVAAKTIEAYLDVLAKAR